MSEPVANVFSVIIAIAGYIGAALYAYILYRRVNPFGYRFLSWYTLLLSLATAVAFTWMFFYVTTAEARAYYDVGPNVIRPLLLLYLSLLICQAITRLSVWQRRVTK
jgi:peptidoglycan biosynthesis protein MviN/MurJ (putative lipid II flippase)